MARLVYAPAPPNAWRGSRLRFRLAAHIIDLEEEPKGCEDESVFDSLLRKVKVQNGSVFN